VRLVALDLTGHGRSEHRPPGIHYHFVDFIPDVVAAADALGWNRFALLGHSLGGGIASFVAATLPERIDRVAMIEGLGPPTSDPADGPANLRKTIQQMDALPHKRPPVYANLEAAIQACGADGYLVKRAYMQERYARIADLTVKILPGGHHPHLEDPEPCAHLLAPFLTAV